MPYCPADIVPFLVFRKFNHEIGKYDERPIEYAWTREATAMDLPGTIKYARRYLVKLKDIKIISSVKKCLRALEILHYAPSDNPLSQFNIMIKLLITCNNLDVLRVYGYFNRIREKDPEFINHMYLTAA